jgi:hypothetical protein
MPNDLAKNNDKISLEVLLLYRRKLKFKPKKKPQVSKRNLQFGL